MLKRVLPRLSSISHCNKYKLYIHEYQAYELLKKYNVPLVPSFRASNPQDAYAIAERVMATTTKTKPFVDLLVKAQVHAGGRGKGTFKESGLKGGVQSATNASEVYDYAQKMLGKTLVTPQTGSGGKKCNEIFLVEKAFLHRGTGTICVVSSSKGGMNIQQVEPNKVHKFFFEPSQKMPISTIDSIIAGFQLPQEINNQIRQLLPKLYQCFIQCDATLLQINPLGINIENKVLICDNKLNIDDNAAFRQKQIFMMEDITQKNWKQVQAQRYDLNYISLDGNIGCMVNGAGLAMATMDIISNKGGFPANFLDVGGRATDEQVIAALRIMDHDPNVQAILVNIFAGIAHADKIALGLIKGISVLGMKKPIVLRMKGTNIELAKEIIADSGFNLFLTEDLDEAAIKAVKMAEILKMARQARLNVSLL